MWSGILWYKKSLTLMLESPRSLRIMDLSRLANCLARIDFSEDIDQEEIEKMFEKKGTSMLLFLNSVMKNLKQVLPLSRPR